MSIESFKIKDEDIKTHGVQSVGDTLTGSAAQNKAVFDRLIKDCVKDCFNKLIDELISPTGANSIGTHDLYSESEKTTVGDLLSLMNSKIDQRALSTDVDTELGKKANTSVTNNHIKNVVFEEATGTFTFIRENGEEISFDTLLDKIAVNFDYNETTQELELTLDSGEIKTVSLASLISEYEFETSDTVNLSVIGHKVKATIKDKCIKSIHLSEEISLWLGSYISEAQCSAQAASDAKTLSEKYKNDTLAYANQARDANTGAVAAQGAAEKAKSGAVAAQDAAEKAKSAAEEAAEEAKTARDEAVEIADFDPSAYMKYTDYYYMNGDKISNTLTSYGLQYKKVNGEGRIVIYSAKDDTGGRDHISEKVSEYMPITPSTLDYATKMALVDPKKTEWSDEEKKAVNNLLSLKMVVEHLGESDSESVTIDFGDFIPDYILVEKYYNISDKASFRCDFEPYALNSGLKVNRLKINVKEFADDEQRSVYTCASSGGSYTIVVERDISDGCSFTFSYINGDGLNDTDTNHELNQHGYTYEFIAIKEGA